MAVSKSATYAIAGGENSVTNQNAYSDDAGHSLSFTVADSATDQQETFTLDVSKAALIFVNSTQAVTMEWNDNAGTQGSLSLLANKPALYTNDGYAAVGNATDMFPADITTTYWTNASGSTATVTIETVYDSTT